MASRAHKAHKEPLEHKVIKDRPELRERQAHRDHKVQPGQQEPRERVAIKAIRG